ncbi:hypothetical protein ZOSMA_94G00550 [Zostera marina]|uniref:Glycosyltransferase family 92 protein n=1 Tax=Zostera marina TaxID=29655 RepID=A0A0K9NIE3_ZOSMR|nr:hypothetical protein ZOSMA_94G00550 [Zostera marina]
MAILRTSTSNQSFISKFLTLITVISLCLAVFAFVLQWKGEVDLSRYLTAPVHERTDTLTFSGSKARDCIESFRSDSYHLTPAFYGGDDRDIHPKICITTTTSDDLQRLLQWVYYHKVIGVVNFFIFVEGVAAEKNTSSVLEAIPGVKVIHKTVDLEKKRAHSNAMNNKTSLSGSFHKTCDHGISTEPPLDVLMAIVMARDAGMDWIIHIDTDELMHPSGSDDYSLKKVLTNVPNDVDMVIFPNYESIIERDDITDPFTEVSLFKRNYEHIAKDYFYSFNKEARHGNDRYFLTYTNGRSAARVQDHLHPIGAFRWNSYAKKTLKEIIMDEAVVLHYTYTTFSDLSSRKDHCSCKVSDAERCFSSNFDRDAFIISSTSNENKMVQWFHQYIVWTDKNIILQLIRHGIMTHITAPMAIIKALKNSGAFSAAVESVK